MISIHKLEKLLIIAFLIVLTAGNETKKLNNFPRLHRHFFISQTNNCQGSQEKTQFFSSNFLILQIHPSKQYSQFFSFLFQLEITVNRKFNRKNIWQISSTFSETRKLVKNCLVHINKGHFETVNSIYRPCPTEICDNNLEKPQKNIKRKFLYRIIWSSKNI